MTNVLANPSPSDLAGALEANLCAHLPVFAQLPGAQAWNDAEVVGVLTDLDPAESCVYRANFVPEQASEKVEQVLQRYRSQGCLPMFWIVGPSTQPADIRKYLEALGFRHFMRTPGMAVDLQTLAPPALFDNFVIERVRNTAQLKEWTRIVATAEEFSEALRNGYDQMFERAGLGPDAPCQLFLGMFAGRPVATSRLFCAGGVAGIYHVGTLPDARRRGFGTAMTLAAAEAGRELGYRFGVLFAFAAGYGLYRRLGFQEYCHMDVYSSPA